MAYDWKRGVVKALKAFLISGAAALSANGLNLKTAIVAGLLSGAGFFLDNARKQFGKAERPISRKI